MTVQVIRTTRRHQRGSAMLIVFVFAAIIAIGLFTEMPVIIFEAQRNKEQLLVDRGNEYIQAVKLYRRKTGQFPPNLDALEKTNQIRFLRKKFVDPFTEKADWRLLHAGPNGMLTDSKIKVAQNVTGAGNSALGTFNTNGSNQSPFGGTTPGNTGFGSGFNNSGNSGFGNNSNSGFNNNSNSGFGNNQNNGFGNNPNNGFRGSNNQNLQTAAQNSGGYAAPNNSGNTNGLPNPNGIDPTQVNQQAGSDGLVQPLPNPDGTMPAMPRNVTAARVAIPNGTNGSATGVIDPTQTTGAYASSGGPPNGLQNASSPQDPTAAVGGLVSNPNPASAQNSGFNNSGSASSPFANNNNNSNSAFGNNNSNSATGNNSFGSNNGRSNSSGFGSSSSGFGNVQSGGLAGVASKVERHSIKVVNDQQNYSLWEFYYDPTKDPAMNAAGAALAQGGANGNVGQPGNSPLQSGNGFGQTNGTNNQSAFGQSGTFGSQSGSSNGFGNSNNGFGNSNSGFSNSNSGFGSNSGFNNSGFSNSSNQNTTTGQQQQTGAPPSPQPPPQ